MRRSFQKVDNLSAKERMEQKRNNTLYCNLKQYVKTAKEQPIPCRSKSGVKTQDHTIDTDGTVHSKSHQSHRNIIHGKQVYLQNFGTSSQKEKVYSRVLKDGNHFQPTKIEDHKYTRFNADRVSKAKQSYPGQEENDGEHYIYNLPINIYYDNANNGSNELDKDEMTQNIYDVYNYFLTYPYSIDPSGQIDYSLIRETPTLDHLFVEVDSSKTIYDERKTLLSQPLMIDEFCDESI